MNFLRPGKLASKFQTYFVDEEANITLVMDTHANDSFKEVNFRVCRYNLSSSLTHSVSCCNCTTSVKCEWGVLENSSSPHPICQLVTSHLGIYQFEIYTSRFRCYQKIGGPIKIRKRSSSNKSLIGLIISIICAAFLAVILGGFFIVFRIKGMYT